jgi:hypothetical protein
MLWAELIVSTGVNNTTPAIRCFPDTVAVAQWQIEQHAYGYIGTSNTSFDNLWASQRALAEGCSRRLADEVTTKKASRSWLSIY